MLKGWLKNMKDDTMLYPSCSEVVWRLNDKDGCAMCLDSIETHATTLSRRYDFTTGTDSYPNGAVETMVDVIKHAIEKEWMEKEEVDNIHVEQVDNLGGGGNWDFIENCLPIAKAVVKGEIDIEDGLKKESKAWHGDDVE